MIASVKTPPGGIPAGLDRASCNAFLEKSDLSRAKAPSCQFENADLREIKRDSIWRLARTASEHLDRLLWALGEDAEIRDQCRSAVSHVRAVAILVNDLMVAPMAERSHLRLVPKSEQPLPDYPRISVMISGINGRCPWGKAGPFRLSERNFHELCRQARRLENGDRQ
jgi:hypothetical protein